MPPILGDLDPTERGLIYVVRRMKGIWAWGFGEFGQLGLTKPEAAPGQSRFFRSQFRVPRPRFVKVSFRGVSLS